MSKQSKALAGYATVQWRATDIQERVYDLLGLEITEDEAEDWLATNERPLQDLLIERGWDYIETRISREDFPHGRPVPPEDSANET